MFFSFSLQADSIGIGIFSAFEPMRANSRKYVSQTPFSLKLLRKTSS